MVGNGTDARLPPDVPNGGRHRAGEVFRHAWGGVRWKMATIVAFTGTSTILVACLAIAAINVMVRRESATVVEKQIQVLVQASRSVVSPQREKFL